MKKVKYLFLLLIALLIVPVMVFADEESSDAENDKQVPVYFFRGEGCSHCAEAEAWFESIEEEYGERFKIVDYETWYNEDNAELMKKVAETRGEGDQANGVPYIIIGDKSWFGFAEEYQDSIKEQIDSVYAQDIADRYDVINYVEDGVISSKKNEKKSGGDVVALIIILAACGGIGFGIYKARKTTN